MVIPESQALGDDGRDEYEVRLVHEGGPTYWDQAAMLLDWGFAQNPSTGVAAL